MMDEANLDIVKQSKSIRKQIILLFVMLISVLSLTFVVKLQSDKEVLDQVHNTVDRIEKPNTSGTAASSGSSFIHLAVGTSESVPPVKEIMLDTTSKMWLDKSYPTALTNLYKKQKGTLNCSAQYIPVYDQKPPIYEAWSYDKEGNYMSGAKLDSKDMIQFLDLTNEYTFKQSSQSSFYNYTVQSIQYCTDKPTTQDGAYEFYIYQVPGNGGGAGNISYIHHTFKALPSGEISLPAVYSSCSPLFADNKDNLYFSCGGGEGPGGSGGVIKYNLRLNTHEQIYSCTTLMDDTKCDF